MYDTKTPRLAAVFAMGIALLAGTLQSAQATSSTDPSARRLSLPRGETRDFGAAPEVPSGALKADVLKALNAAFGDNLRSGQWGAEQFAALETIALSKDPRIAWVLSDFMRIVSSQKLNALLSAATSELLETEVDERNAWATTTDRLIAWDIPAPPDYLRYKRNIFTTIVPEWERIFTEGDIDWRHVSWGGVRIDDRAFGATDTACNCIPAADNPPVTSAADATWLGDDAVVFGVEINGEFRAYPRRIMEVREMVNDTLGGRSLGIPYCTLCAAAQAYFTDQMPAGVERPVLRTSGLLIRSNKVMYDVNTFSVFDTFRGSAVTGSLAKKGITLQRAGVVTSRWGEWKKAHPTTTVLAEALALGRDFDFRNNRDANGPIFPIGNVDVRLAVHEDVLGVVTDRGTPVAFHLKTTLAALKKGEKIIVDNVHLVLDGDGVRAVDAGGKNLGSHQAFWFAWSQFYPKTRLWPF
jgi:hypothetical protein